MRHEIGKNGMTSWERNKNQRQISLITLKTTAKWAVPQRPLRRPWPPLAGLGAAAGPSGTACKQVPSSFLSHGLCGKVQIL